MRSTLQGLYAGCNVLASMFMALITFLILQQIVGRLMGIIIVPEAKKLAGYSFAALTFLALAPTLRSGVHVRVSLLLSRLPSYVRRWFEVWGLLVSLIFLIYCTYWTADLTLTSYRFNDVSSGVLAFPLWIPQLGMTLGMAVMVLSIAEILYDLLRGQEPPYQSARRQAEETASVSYVEGE